VANQWQTQPRSNSESAGPDNKGMKLSERGSLGGECSAPAGVVKARSAAYAQCWTDLRREPMLKH